MDNNLNYLRQKSNMPRTGGLMRSMLKALFDDAPASVSARDSFQGRLRQHLKDNEGVKEQPYKDSKGLLTVGVGINVSGESDFVALPFEKQNPQTKEWEPATEAEKRAEFRRLNGMTRDAIDNDGNRFHLDETAIDTNLDQQIAVREKAVIDEIGREDWDKLTDGQKIALMDIQYANGSLRKFPKLKQAVKNGDVEAMVRESSFTGGELNSGEKVYNFDRVRRNFAVIMGIDPDSEEAYKYVALKHGEHPRLTNPDYTKHRAPAVVSPDVALDGFVKGIIKNSNPKRELMEHMYDLKSQKGMSDNFIDTISSPTSPVDPVSSTDPRVGAMLELMESPVSRPGLAALLKPVETLTKSEMTDMINSAQSDYRGWRSGDPLKAHTYEKVQDWHVAMYGDGPQQYDGGKAIDPAPIRPIPAQPTPHVTPDGGDLWQAMAGLGRTVVRAANADGFETAIQGLQQGLNRLNQHNPLPPRSPAYGPYTKLEPVKVDGVYGPRTDFALKQTTARLGPDKVERGLALGRFNDFARKAQKTRTPDGLEQATQTAFAGLFDDPAKAPSTKAVNSVLQDTLNRFGGQAYDDWQPLKQDNWIGPKTTTAFGRVLEKDDADTLTTAFGRGLGLV